MKIKTYLLCFLFCVLSLASSAKDLFFQSESFKIMQLTDIHWKTDSLTNQLTLGTIKYLLQKENPDLVIITGDIITDLNTAKAWRDLIQPLIDHETSWIATLGNHDSELNCARDSVYQILRDLPYNLNHIVLESFSLPIYNAKNEIGSVLYFFDSNAYPTFDYPSKYDWIKLDQINWYIEKSDSYSALNNYCPIPSYAFFHIPLNEYKIVAQSNNYIGNYNEDISSSELNTGLYAAMIQQKDIIGTFCGHDHNNDFIGKYHNIALAYGRSSGLQGYGDLRNGARIIEIYPNTFDFKSWISIPNQELFTFNYIENSLETVNANDPLPAKQFKLNKLTQGVQYKYFEGDFENTDNINKLSPINEGITPKFNLEIASRNDHYSIIFQGIISLEETTQYTFYLASDDGAKLLIDNQLVVDNDGSHSYRLKDNSIALEEGFHEIEVRYFENYMGQSLEVGISSKYIPKMLIPEQWLYHQ